MGIGHTVLDSDEFPVFEKRDLQPDLLEDDDSALKDSDNKRDLEGKTTDYQIISQSTYALGVHELRRKAEVESVIGQPRIEIAGSLVYRPFSFHENILARVETYETVKTEEERTKLFDTWLDSCTRIAYKKKTTKFKIIPICNELITIPESFKGNFLPIDYSKIDGVELNSATKYNTSLTKSEILEHDAWRACVENDIPLLKNYGDIVFAEYNKKYRTKVKKLMRFCVRQNTDEDELRAVYVYSLGSDSDASGLNYLSSDGRFLLGSPVAKKIGVK